MRVPSAVSVALAGDLVTLEAMDPDIYDRFNSP